MSTEVPLTPTKPEGEKPSFSGGGSRGGRKTVDTSHSNESSDGENSAASLDLRTLKKKIKQKEIDKQDQKNAADVAAIKGTD
eukprot:CAMPEP_0114427280 /NCGR_PEP_ID=MMETSP0103-20121206/8257_1 /TAXON_ID=37642 ORGANISM="Paraphysomonas imperforata, Strain PA2" /NCGR_SAMPLE_ID=MMETSP0103 /ASSEMBLY_ACC=CAM_ASM_000201 /LENGTH=81 /DNA_ID=CAMNT_0001596317 /DNA_START=68 /DNA_END=310 /DNA_ORIENTATION=-